MDGVDRVLERNASRHFMTKRIVERIESGEPSCLRDEAMGGDERVTAEALREAWDANDALVREEIARGARYLGIAIANALSVVPMPVVILGGGLSESMGEPYADLVRASIEENLFPREGRDPIDVRLTGLRENAGLLGASPWTLGSGRATTRAGSPCHESGALSSTHARNTLAQRGVHRLARGRARVGLRRRLPARRRTVRDDVRVQRPRGAPRGAPRAPGALSARSATDRDAQRRPARAGG